MYVSCNVNQCWLYCSNETLKFFLCCHFEYLLTKVVAELIKHQLIKEWDHTFHESSLEVSIWNLFLKSFLKHTAPLLVITKEVNLPNYILVLF